jgi:hypothetical protein
LDAIFAEAYSRWGGRRTLIIPASSDGIDARFSGWLLWYGADIIYSYVELSDKAVEALHEACAPAHLLLHNAGFLKPEQSGYYRPALPIQDLSSLSVLSAFSNRAWGFQGRPTNVKVLNRYGQASGGSFLAENFGFISQSFPNGMFGSPFPDLFTSLTLIDEESLNNRHLGKDVHAEYHTSEEKILEILGGTQNVLTLSNLAEFFAPHLNIRSYPSRGVNVVVGDSVADRLLFWNGYHSYETPDFHQAVSLRLPVAQVGDAQFLKMIRAIVDLRGVRPYDGQQAIELHSIEGFVTKVAELRPQLVSFNGSSFDLPVLRYRAMLNQVAAPGLFTRNYFSRYSEDALDLCDALSSFDGRSKLSLDELSRLLMLGVSQMASTAPTLKKW